VLSVVKNSRDFRVQKIKILCVFASGKKLFRENPTPLHQHPTQITDAQKLAAISNMRQPYTTPTQIPPKIRGRQIEVIRDVRRLESAIWKKKAFLQESKKKRQRAIVQLPIR
jgi:hypothetical protein